MELRPHFRVVRFSPVPEYLEPVNVALLIIDQRPRLVSDFVFEKLACISPSFDREVLQVWLKSIAEEIRGLPPAEISSRLTSRTSQIQLGRENYIKSDIHEPLEQHLIQTFLKKAPRPTRSSEKHLQYIDTLIDGVIGRSDLMYGDVLKRAQASSFLTPESVSKLATSSIRFSRVIVAPRALVIMDGLNLGITSRAQLRLRAAEVGFGFFQFGEAKGAIETIERKEILRASLAFNRPSAPDKELDCILALLKRDSDISVDTASSDEVFEFNKMLRQKSLLT
jgi:hypothetical protein